MPRNAFPHAVELRWVCFTSGEVRRLAVFLNAYLHKHRDGHPIDLGSGPLPNSRFFDSLGSYDAFYTCNTWTIAALAFSGLPVKTQGVVFAGQVMTEVRSLPRCMQGQTHEALPSTK